MSPRVFGLLSCTALLFSMAGTARADWLPLPASGGESPLQIERQRTVLDQGVVAIWVLRNLTTAGLAANDKPYRSVIAKEVIYCAENRIATAYAAFYASRDGIGEVVEQQANVDNETLPVAKRAGLTRMPDAALRQAACDDTVRP